MSEVKTKDVLKDFIKDLSELSPLTEQEYISCCIKSIMEWENEEYWNNINKKSRELLDMDVKDLCNNKYRIRTSYDETNNIYKKIYEREEIVGNDYHGEHLYETLRGISFKQAKKELGDLEKSEEFKDGYFKDYRISHVWGCTKNIYLNNLPFNYFAIPSFCYCLSDKNNGGEVGKKFRRELKAKVVKKCQENVELYNKKMVSLSKKYLKNLNNYLENMSEQVKKHAPQRLPYVLGQFILIPIDIKSDCLEEGLKIFKFEDNKVSFTDEYKNAKKDNFRDFYNS